jgi:hypothetical protein
MPSKTSPAKRKHAVNAKLQILDMTRAGSSLNLKIYAEGKKLGEIELGRGSITWFRRNARTGKPLSWTKFADIMNAATYGE